jgi:hypothetical protein
MMPITFTLTEIILLITNTLAVGYALHYWDAHRKASFFLESIFTDLDFRKRVLKDYDEFAAKHG